jgi:serine/threonine-protein kinase
MSSTSLINAVIGEYRIVDRLGEGGMGEVYRAVHAKIGRTAALKLMSRAIANPEFVERFLNEARIQANLHHPNIATLYDFCEFDGRPCIIMEYIEGETLTEFIQRRGILSKSETLSIFRSIVDAIGYVHARGIIHRDIKSNNVKITKTGEVKLLDFGIAKSGSSPALTMTGAFIGTLQYISPEQFTGGIADARSDIWALGVLLYEMLTGRLPFQADSIGGLYERINAAAYAPPAVFNNQMPAELEAVIRRCLRRNPNERYQSAREMLNDLERLLSSAVHGPAASAVSTAPANWNAPTLPAYAPTSLPGSPTTAPQAGRTSPVPASSGMPDSPAVSSSSTRLIMIAGAAVLGSAILIGGALYALSGDDTPPSSPAQPGQQQPTKPAAPAAGAQASTFTIEVMEGQAEVFKGSDRIGATPYKFEAKPGDPIDLVLKRDGYRDMPLRFVLSENKKIYTFTMQKNQ